MASFAFDIPCLDPLACNFMEEGECFFIDENGNPCVIEGCTIQGACNYDPEADLYDGSCEFESCLGCTDEAACNYDDFALYNDGSCIYSAPFSLSIAANIDYFDDEFNGYGACIDTGAITVNNTNCERSHLVRMDSYTLFGKAMRAR